MRIRWHGHACFELGDAERTIIIDPHDGRSLGIKPPAASADVVLMTHDHYDHRAAWIIGGKHTDIMAKEGIFEARGMEFEGLKTYHDTSQGSERGINMMYLFEMEGLRICHCGDLGCIPDDSVLSKIKGADILMVPTGEVFTMVLPEVRRFIEIVNPNIIIPMHYRVGGLTLPITPLDDFLEMMPEDYVDYVGNEIDVASDDLTEMKECWVFDR